MNIETNLQRIKFLALEREDENWEFRTYLKFHHAPEILDQYVNQYYEHVVSEIDCTRCGNCCREISPVLTDEDITRLAEHIELPEAQFIETYLVFDEIGDRVFGKTPCPFLNNTICTCYSSRPKDCRSYPHLHKPDTMKRLGGIVANCDTCPIVFNVYELLKRHLWTWTS